MLEEIRKLLRIFLESKRKNEWLVASNAKVYVRHSKRLIDNRLQDCLDIASIEIDEEFRSQGIFKKILETFEEENPFEYIAIESIINPRLLKHIKSQEDWKPYLTSEDTFVKKQK